MPPRKSYADRYPSGELKSSHRTQTQIKQTVRAQRYKDRVLRGLDDPNYENALGRLFMIDAITGEQREAGDLFDRLVRRYASLIGIPMPHPKTANYQGGYGLVLKPDVEPERIAALKDEYDTVYAVLCDCGKATGASSRLALIELVSVAVLGRDTEAPALLKLALTALVDHWQMQGKGEGKSSGARKVARMMAADARPKHRPELHTAKPEQSGAA